jgi:hypothetical protein
VLNDWTKWNAQPLKEGQRIEISEHIYYELMNCLPPHVHLCNYFEVGEPNHHDSQGKPVHRACWIEDGKYYTGYPHNTKDDIKIGSTLTAIAHCVMEESGEESLIVGKQYIVLSNGGCQICVIDEQGHEHYFSTDKYNPNHWGKYFRA